MVGESCSQLEIGDEQVTWWARSLMPSSPPGHANPAPGRLLSLVAGKLASCLGVSPLQHACEKLMDVYSVAQP